MITVQYSTVQYCTLLCCTSVVLNIIYLKYSVNKIFKTIVN